MRLLFSQSSTIPLIELEHTALSEREKEDRVLRPVFGCEDGVIREAVGAKEPLSFVVCECEESIILSHNCWILHCLHVYTKRETH